MQSSGDEAIRALREALAISPDNVPLRQHLAESLLGLGRAEEAEQEYRLILSRSQDDPRSKLGLATAFYQQGKDQQALVLVESMAHAANVPPRAFLLHARLLLRNGEADKAAAAYRRALEFDPTLTDADLAEQLGVAGASPGQQQQNVFEGKLAAAWDMPSGYAELDSERPTITFADVGGMEALKDEIRLKIVHPLQHPELYRAYGKPIGGGILLYGPPGCGKTHLARATAGEIKASFIAVGISDVLDMWIGNSEKNLHELFGQARRARPCVLFFDEVDALGASRSDLRQSGGRHLINQFLSEMDGVQDSNEGVLILAATNAPWHLDPAFRRPGRFDRVLFVPPPDQPARAAILRILSRGKPLGDIDFDNLAKKSDSFSGADLKAVLDLTVEAKLREAMKEGVPKPITTKDMQSAIGQVKPSTREWFATARNYALYSNQGGVYDDVLRYLKLT
jgi:ATP-dependent 26S proteasome regulatory subunit